MATRQEIANTMKEVEKAVWNYGSEEPRRYHFTDGESVDLDITANIIEPVWESFEPAAQVTFNGDTKIFGNDSVNVGSYHNEQIQVGLFSDADKMIDAIEKVTDLSSLERVTEQPSLDVDARESKLNEFMEQPEVVQAQKDLDRTRKRQRQSWKEEANAYESNKEHWDRVRSAGGFIHVAVHPQQVHPVKSKTALQWDRNYHEGQEQRFPRTIEDGPNSVTNQAPVWVDVAKDKRIFVPSGLMDRLEDNTYQVTMEPNNTKKVFTGPSLKGEAIDTREIEDMLVERSKELDGRSSSVNFITVPSSNVTMRQRKSDGAAFGVVQMPVDGVGEHAPIMSFTVDSRQMRDDPVQAGSTLINLNPKSAYKVQYSDANRQAETLSTFDLMCEVASAMSKIAWQNVDEQKRQSLQFIADTQESNALNGPRVSFEPEVDVREKVDESVLDIVQEGQAQFDSDTLSV